MILRRRSFASQRHKGTACLKELFKTSPTERIPVQQEAQKIDTLLANLNFGRQSDSFALNVPKQVDMILSSKRRTPGNQLKKDDTDAP